MIGPINNTTPSKKPFGSFKNAPRVKKAYLSHRYRNRDVVTTRTKVQSFIGALAGTVASMAIFAKLQKTKIKNPKDLLKINYGLKEMSIMSGISIIGGVLGGMIGSDRKKEKVNEGVFQFMNAALPPLVVAPALKVLDNSKSLKDSKIARVAVTIGFLLAGMKIGTIVSNYINDPQDKVPDRKLTMKDAIANVDDALGALAVAKFPLLEKLQIEKTLPAIFTWCGYRAGQSN